MDSCDYPDASNAFLQGSDDQKPRNRDNLRRPYRRSVTVARSLLSKSWQGWNRVC